VSTLVLITGTGRSGTSTMSGTLHHLGLYVPGPYLGANESNPKGFFESKWAMRFHKELTNGAGINDFDSRPEAFDLAQGAVTDELRTRLRDFLVRESAGHDQMVVKDPRSVWAQRLWRDVAAEVGLDIRYVSMLRHPAEVIGSRSTYYASRKDEAARRSYETFSVARWINGSLVSERETRGEKRAFVSYHDLLADWRPVLAGLADDLGLTYDVDVTGGEPTPVDEFIDPGLRRHSVTWDELGVPDSLRTMAEAIWGDLLALQAAHGDDAGVSADLDARSSAYQELFQDSSDIAHDALESDRHRLQGKAERAEVAPTTAPKPRKAPRPPGPRTVEEQPVGHVGGRDLLRVLAGRVGRKVKRW
jgi:hypothetical protein